MIKHFITIIYVYQFVHLFDHVHRDKRKQNWSNVYVEGPKYLDKPVKIIINNNTFSAGELVAYFMKEHKRATIIGELSKGAAHTTKNYIVDDLIISVPYWAFVTASDDRNWEGVGVIPDNSI